MDYRYRWVSTTLRGEHDSIAIRRAEAGNWVPVPDDEIPPDMKPGPVKDGLRLYRKAEHVVAAEESDRQAYNRMMARPETHIAEANRRIAEHVARLNLEHDRTDAGDGWSEIGGAGSSNEGTEVKYVPKVRHWHT